MTPIRKIKFSDLLRLPKSAPIPPEVNAIVVDIIRAAFKNDETQADALLDLAAIENGKWYGAWNLGGAEVHFRYGVCDRIIKPVDLKSGTFEMIILNNENVDFSKQRKCGFFERNQDEYARNERTSARFDPGPDRRARA